MAFVNSKNKKIWSCIAKTFEEADDWMGIRRPSTSTVSTHCLTEVVAHQLSAALRCFNPPSHTASCDLSSSHDGRVQVNDPFFHTLAHVLTNMINPRPPGPPPKEQSLLPKYLNLHQLFTNWRNLLDERRDIIMKLTAAFFLNSQYYRCNVTHVGKR